MFQRTKTTVAAIEEEIQNGRESGKNTEGEMRRLDSFLTFLKSLDPDKTEVYYEQNETEHCGNHGWRVVHFTDRIEEQWHNTWMTWFGLGGWMS